MPTNPSLLIVPYRFKAAKLYSQLPESGAGDFTVTRSTTATRTNASGLLESVASGVPRLDYPIGGGCPALLVEPAATNLSLRSEEFDNAAWVKLNSTVTANATTAPNNTLTADKLVEDTTNNIHAILPNSFPSVVSGTTYTISIYAKAAERTRIYFRDNNRSNGGANFDLLNGTVISNEANVLNSTINFVGNGWYRCTVTYTSSSTSSNVQVRLINTGTNQTYLGDGTSGVFLWGAQLETGSVATSYIPTVAATQTRNADVISVSSVSGLIGQTQGTIYAEVDLRNLTKETHFIRIDGGASTNVITLRTLTNNVVRTNITAPTTSGTLNISSAEFISGVVKIAFAYKSGDIALSVNGASALTANGTFAFNAALSRIFLGSNDGTSFLNDRIRAVALYSSRLSNAELATLTTL